MLKLHLIHSEEKVMNGNEFPEFNERIYVSNLRNGIPYIQNYFVNIHQYIQLHIYSMITHDTRYLVTYVT
ncbi:hypothetical protein RIF29_24022 [Crotalaria pallida]|uniref:Uncharacterized protein n=1 Tax=Crotalaria pallida TaxID=3830 RepID=A0AAN9HZS0_CROPI